MVYNDLQPVVVYIDGDDLSQEEEEALQPSASLAHDHKTVFVSVNYRYVHIIFTYFQKYTNHFCMQGTSEITFK